MSDCAERVDERKGFLAMMVISLFHLRVDAFDFRRAFHRLVEENKHKEGHNHSKVMSARSASSKSLDAGVGRLRQICDTLWPPSAIQLNRKEFGVLYAKLTLDTVPGAAAAAFGLLDLRRNDFITWEDIFAV